MNNFSIAIAIDFGTTFSGYAYCLKSDTSEGDIYKNTEWYALVGQTTPYVKTPTYLLYKGKKLDSWGYRAKRRLVELRLQNQDSTSSYHFFEKFKTLLFEYKKVGLAVDENGNPYLEDSGEKFFIVDLVADYLREISLIALNDIKTHITIDEETKIRWCLTIPAIWDDSAKQMMEQAAFKAGILKKGDWDSGNFMFALEPEAAAVYCLRAANRELSTTIENASIMMIVDCGGGTVDLTVHKIILEGKERGLDELVPGFGAAAGHGGKDVDKNFLNYLAEILGGGAIDKFEAKYPDSYLEMMDDWEMFKCGFNPENYKTGKFRIPSELQDILQSDYPNALKKLKDKQNGRSSHIIIYRDVVENIFNPIVNSILSQVEKMFNNIGGHCDYLYLVGGFATSPYLQQRIKAKFNAYVKKNILIPNEPGKSIMVGAASFARNPEIIYPRKARLTYGVASSTTDDRVLLLMNEFLKNEVSSEVNSALEKMIIDAELNSNYISKILHPFRNKAKEMGKDVFIEHLKGKFGFDEENQRFELYGLFTTFIRFGDTIVKNHQVPQLFYVTNKYMQEATIHILATKEKEVVFADEKGVEEIGQIELKLPPIEGNRKVEVTMYFGDTKLKVKAKSLESDEEIETELHFSSGHFTD